MKTTWILRAMRAPPDRRGRYVVAWNVHVHVVKGRCACFVLDDLYQICCCRDMSIPPRWLGCPRKGKLIGGKLEILQRL